MPEHITRRDTLRRGLAVSSLLALAPDWAVPGAAGRAVSQTASDTAVVTKILRVLVLAPALVIVSRLRRNGGAGISRKIKFPWFVVWFGAVIVVQSLAKLPSASRPQDSM